MKRETESSAYAAGWYFIFQEYTAGHAFSVLAGRHARSHCQVLDIGIDPSFNAR